MKLTTIFLLLVTAATGASAGGVRAHIVGGPPAQDPRAQAIHDEIVVRQQAKERADYIRNWMPEDPWRQINGTTNFARGDGWYQFTGRIVDVTTGGIRVEGIYDDPPLAVYDRQKVYEDFFVAHYPYEATNDKVIGTQLHLTARRDGTYTYTTVQGGSRTIKRFEYGHPCSAPPPTAEQIAAAKAAHAKRIVEIKAAQDKALQVNQKMADEGNAYGQLRMGERYLKGEGVDRDELKARNYLELSAAQGNTQAQDLLKSLSTKQNTVADK